MGHNFTSKHFWEFCRSCSGPSLTVPHHVAAPALHNLLTYALFDPDPCTTSIRKVGRWCLLMKYRPWECGHSPLHDSLYCPTPISSPKGVLFLDCIWSPTNELAPPLYLCACSLREIKLRLMHSLKAETEMKASCKLM